MLQLYGRLLFLLLTFCLSAGQVRADYYRYVSKDGGIGFVDDIKKVPAAYRDSAILIREAKPDPAPAKIADPDIARPVNNDGAPIVTPTPESIIESPPTNIVVARPRAWGWLALCLTAAGAGLVLFCQLLKTLQSRQLARVILFGATMGILVLGYKLYVDQMVSNYFSVKSKVLQLMTKAMQRTENPDPEAR